MNTILVPVDYSLASFNAFHYALKIAERFSSRVILYHACTAPVVTPHAGVNIQTSAQEEADNRARRYLQELEYSVPPHIARHIELELHTDVSTPEEGIEQMCYRANPSLIVMGMKVRGALSGALMGSTVTRVLGQEICPVLVVPEGAQYRPIRHIAFGSMLDEKEEPTIDRLLEFAFLNEAVIHCVHVKTPEESEDSELSPRFSALKAFYRDDIILNQIEIATVSHANALVGLMDYAQENNIDILAVQARKRNFWSRLFHPSISKRMVYLSRVPILVFSPV